KQVELARVWRRLQPLATDTMPLDVPPPRASRLRIAAGAQPRALGQARTGGRGQVSDLDRRQSAAPGCLRRSARGQARGRGAAFTAVSEAIAASLGRAPPDGNRPRRRS